MIHFAATGNPVADIEKAVLWLKDKKEKVSVKNVSKATPYTRVQIAGLLGREEHLRLFFNSVRTT